MTTLKTTIKTRAAYVPTDLAMARNSLAIAIRNAKFDPTEANLKLVETIQADVEALEDQYHEGAKALLDAELGRGGNHVHR